MKKILCLMLCLVMVFSVATHVHAETYDRESYDKSQNFIKTIMQKPTLELVNNKYTSGNRSFLVSWSSVKGASCYEIKIADNRCFKDAITKTVIRKHPAVTGRSYTFAGGKENKTYYVKVRPVFYLSDYDITINGRWSNIVIAEAIE